MSKKALLICGGAFKGAFDLPILKAYDVDEFDYVCGVSVGAINGAMFASGKLDKLERIWLDVRGKSPVFGVKGFMAPCAWRNRGLYSLNPTHKKLKEYIDAKGLHTVFQAGVVSRQDGDYHQLSFDASSSTQRLHRAILASAAMAGVHEPWTVRIKGEPHLCSDGGHIHVLPKIPFDCTSVVAIFHRPTDIPEREKEEVDGLGEAFQWAMSLQMAAQSLADYQQLVLWAQHPANSATVYAPKKSLGKPFDTKRMTIKARIEAGEEALKNPLEL